MAFPGPNSSNLPPIQVDVAPWTDRKLVGFTRIAKGWLAACQQPEPPVAPAPRYSLKPFAPLW